jgi:hypothetical protein
MFRPRTFRFYTIFLALGAFVAAAVPFTARAQMGDALAQAEQTCLDNGVGPYTVAFDTCVARAAHAYINGEPEVAGTQARRIGDARQTCMSYDIDPMTLGFHQCVASESRQQHYASSFVPDSYQY